MPQFEIIFYKEGPAVEIDRAIERRKKFEANPAAHTYKLEK